LGTENKWGRSALWTSGGNRRSGEERGEKGKQHEGIIERIYVQSEK